MREVILDTETTGLDPSSGHRIVEIGCIETQNHIPTGDVFQCYVDPERDMPEGAFAVHGLSSEFLADKPKFADIADQFLAFIGDDPLVIHNAEFDLRFLNAELILLGKSPLERSRAVDTVGLARRRYPGAQVSLDALCRRFEIDLTRREKHGALLDAELLAEVYLYLMGGRQPGLDLHVDTVTVDAAATINAERPTRSPRPHAPSAAEAEAHEALLDQITQPIWRSGRTGDSRWRRRAGDQAQVRHHDARLDSAGALPLSRCADHHVRARYGGRKGWLAAAVATPCQGDGVPGLLSLPAAGALPDRC